MEQKYVILFFILFLFIILRLRKKCSRTKKENQELKQQIQLQNQKADDFKEKKANIQLNLENNLRDYYSLKNSCMNNNESRVFFYLNCILDEFFSDLKERENFVVFPQVSLHSFIKINSGIENDYMARDIALQNLGGKNVDFIICQRYKKDSYYLYRPVILIEVDGKSHRTSSIFGKETFSKQQKNDAFKNNITAVLGLPLFRYEHDDNITRGDRDKIKQELYHYFQQMGIL